MSIRTILNGERWARLLDPRKLVLICVTAFVGIPAVIPLLLLVWDSFKETSVGNLLDLSLSNFTLQNYARALSNPDVIPMLGDSLLFAFGSMLVALLFGGTIAFLVERTNTPLRNVIYGLMFIPLIMPGILKAIAWILLLNPDAGILNLIWFSFGFSEPLFNAYSIPAMFWVQGLSESPLTFLMLGAALRVMDPSLEEAAYTAGAGKVSTMSRITLRLMMPAIAGVMILQFVRGLEAFEVPLIMGLGSGINVFSTNIYYNIREAFPPDYGLAFVYSLVLIFLCVIGILLYRRVLVRSERYATVSGKGYRPRIIDLGKKRLAAGAFIIFFVVVAVVLPLLVLLWTSLLPYYMAPSMKALSVLTLSNYQVLVSRSDFLLMLKNTLILSVSVSVGGMILATMVSWIVVRLRPKGSGLLDILVFLPIAIPSIAIGVSFMISFLAFPLLHPFYNTVWIMVLAYLVRFMPLGTRFTHAGLAQIRVELEEAAASSGAGLFTTLRRVTMPLMLPSLIAGGLYLFLLSLKIMSVAAILYSPKSIILPIYIFTLWANAKLPLVGALAVLMVIVTSIITIVARQISQRHSMVSEQ